MHVVLRACPAGEYPRLAPKVALQFFMILHTRPIVSFTTTTYLLHHPRLVPRVSVLVKPHRFADRRLKRSWKRSASIRPTSIYEVSPCKVILVHCRRLRYRRAIRRSYIYLLTGVGQLYATSLFEANQVPRSVLCNTTIRYLALCHLEKEANTS